MSSTIEHDRKVLYQPAGSEIGLDITGIRPHTLYENEYYIFIKQGTSSIEHKRWFLAVSGWKYTVVSTIGHRARSAESGSLRFQNGYITPEKYLRLYRQEIRNAKLLTLEALQTELGIFQLRYSNIRETKMNTEEYKSLLQYFTPSTGSHGVSLSRPLNSLDDFFIWHFLSYKAHVLDARIELLHWMEHAILWERSTFDH